MFHLIHWSLSQHNEQIYIDSGTFGIEVTYVWEQEKGTYFLYPVIDVSRNTVKYYAFDTIFQKKKFLKILKIQWIWGKSAYQIAMIAEDELEKAVEEMDVNFFKQLPGVWVKTAKRLVVELKTEITKSEFEKFDISEKLYNDIITSLQWLWYDRKAIKTHLPDCHHKLIEKNLPKIMKRLIGNL